MNLPESAAVAAETLRLALEHDGHAVLRGLLSAPQYAALAAAAAGPLPEVLRELHATLQPILSAVVTPWQALLVSDGAAPCDTARAAAGALLRLEAGEFRPLAHSVAQGPRFPLQASVLLSCRGADFRGGELVLVEQRPRQQSKPIVVDLQAGDVAIFPARQRPVRGARGPYRVTTRHAVTRVFAGRRVSAELLFEP